MQTNHESLAGLAEGRSEHEGVDEDDADPTKGSHEGCGSSISATTVAVAVVIGRVFRGGSHLLLGLFQKRVDISTVTVEPLNSVDARIRPFKIVVDGPSVPIARLDHEVALKDLHVLFVCITMRFVACRYQP